MRDNAPSKLGLRFVSVRAVTGMKAGSGLSVTLPAYQ